MFNIILLINTKSFTSLPLMNSLPISLPTTPISAQSLPFEPLSPSDFSDSFSSESLTPLWRLKDTKRLQFSLNNGFASEPSTPRTGPISTRSENSICLNQAKINEQVKEFLSSKEYKVLTMLWKGNTSIQEELTTKWEKHGCLIEIEPLLNTFKSVLDLSQIKFEIYTETHSDSKINILPIQDELALSQYITTLLLQIPNFPNTFFKAIGLKKFSFCQFMKLQRSCYKEVYYKKVLKGFFEIENYNNPQAIKLHFYKLLCYCITKKKESLSSHWKNLNQCGFSYTKNLEDLGKYQNIKGFLEADCMKSLQTDQALILEKLLVDPKGLLGHSDGIVRRKAQLMMETLVAIDPNFELLEGWEMISILKKEKFLWFLKHPSQSGDHQSL